MVTPIEEDSGGEIIVGWGYDPNYGPAVYVNFGNFFIGIDPSQAKALGDKLIEAAGKVIQ